MGSHSQTHGLDPGQSYPAIDTNWNVNGDITGTVPVYATAYTAGQLRLSGAQGRGTVTEAAAAADLTATVTDSGPVQAGGMEDLTVNVADAADAGPATGDVSVTVPMPSQLHPTSVYGDGWDCSASGADVTCHPRHLGGSLAGEAGEVAGRELRPGSMLPPITVGCDATAP
jgi:hypothetical protein